MNARQLFGAWLGLFLLFATFAHGNLETDDSALTMHGARALLLRFDSGLRDSTQEPQWVGEGVIADHMAATGHYGMTGRNGLHYVWFPMGHQWLMLPAIAAGEALDALFPAVERAYRQQVAPLAEDHQLAATDYRYGQFVFDHALVALLPAAFGAVSVILAWLMARTLGCARRDALLATAAVAFASQLFPLTRETLSDGPGACFLLAALYGVVRYQQGDLAARGLGLAGFAAGWAVLTRYPHALMVAVLLASVAIVAIRRRRPRELLAFCLGGLPCLLLFCLVNYLRFGTIGETGYGNSAVAQWFNYPPWLGLPKILFAAGKGIMWFSPVLWLAVPLAFGAAVRGHLRWLAVALFALPVLMFSNTLGWQSGQCWGVRYVTPGVLALLAIVLPVARPWQRWPRLFAALVLLGVAVNVTSIVAPTRGHNQLASQATRAFYEQKLARGEIQAVDLQHLDPADHFFFLPRFSPLHSHWTYAWLSLTGAFEDRDGQPTTDPGCTIEPLFGVTSADPLRTWAPRRWEDRRFRHLWWRFWADLLGVSSWWLLLPWVAAVALALARGLRPMLSRN